MRGSATVLIVCLMGLVAPAQGANEVSYGPPPAWVKDVAIPKADGSMAEAPVKLLTRSYQLKFSAKHLEMHVESFFALQTPQGLQALGNIALPWKPDTDVLTVHRCRLLRGDRAIDLLAEGKKFEVLRRENNLEYAALDGVLTAVLQPAGMQVGDVLDLAFTIRRESTLIPAPEIVLANFADAPASRVQLRVVWDQSTPLRWRASQDMKGIREVRNSGEHELAWVAEGLEPLKQPLDVPSRLLRFPMVEFTSYASWNDVSRTLAPLYSRAVELRADSPVKLEARAIAQAQADPVARLEAALRLVQDRVRYVFLGMGDGNIDPAGADLTWERRFGDCKGKTALLMALLRELGIQAEPVLVATVGGDAVNDRLPMMGAFNHVIVRAHAAGRTWWLDGAGSGTWRRIDLGTPNYQWGLPISARGDGLVRMLAEPAAEPQVETSTAIDARAGIYTDAPFKGEVRIRGAAAVMLQAQLSQLAPAQREQALREYWKSQYDFVEVQTVSSDFDDAGGAILLRMEGTAEMDWGGYRYVTDGMRVGSNADYAREPGINADAPFVIDHPAYTVTRQRIQLPAAGEFVADGADFDVTLAGRHFTRHSKLADRVFSGEVLSRSLVSEISAQEARAAQRQLNDMWKDRLDIVASNYQTSDADVAALGKRKFTDRANLVWRGNIFLERLDYDAALADFDAAVKLDAKNANSLAHRGLAYFWKRDMQKAELDFNAALAIEAENAVALRGLGALQRSRGDNKSAVELLTRSLRRDPGDTFALSNRAYAHAMLAEDEAALADAAAAIKLRPGIADMYDLRAWILLNQGHDEQASQELAAMRAANPRNARAEWFAAHHLWRLGRYDEAVKAMDFVIAEKASAENYFRRSEVRDPADLAGRIADLDAALALDSAPAYIALRRAQLQSEAGDHRAALAGYTTRLKNEHGMSEQRRLRVLRGIEYLRLGDAAAARKDLDAALADDPDGDTYNNFCWSLAVARVELDAALRACDKALAVAPKDSAYLDSRGFVLLQLGRFDEAVAAYDAALALAPRRAVSLYARGLGKKRRCGCADGDADLEAGMRGGDPAMMRMFALAGLAP
jgi:tetratricopeptide (TPR) repeat protein